MRMGVLVPLTLGFAIVGCDAPRATLAAPELPARAAIKPSSTGTTCAQTTTGARTPSPWQPAALDRAAFLAEAARHGRVASVEDYGVHPNTGQELSLALRHAIRLAGWDHVAALLLPAGEYLVGGEVPMVSAVAIIGEGCGRTVIRRTREHAGQMLFRVVGVNDVRVQGIDFDLNHAPAYFRAIGLRGPGSREVVIVDDCFRDSDPNTSGDDRFAVELSAEKGTSSRVWIGRNRVSDYMQLTAGGGDGIDVLRIVDNGVDNAEQNAIAVTEASAGSVFRDVVIARNQVTRAHGVGIYLGPDKPGTPRGRFEDVTIADNSVSGLVNRYAHAVYVRAADQRHLRMTITRNLLEAGTAQEANGIRTDDTYGAGSNLFTDVLVTDNTLRGFSRGIWLSPLENGFVARNQVDGTRPYLTDPRSINLCVQP